MGFFWLYSQVLLKTDDERKEIIQKLFENYELIWIMSCIALLGVSVSYVWDWHIIPKVAFGGETVFIFYSVQWVFCSFIFKIIIKYLILYNE